MSKSKRKTLIKTYTGWSQTSAIVAFQKDAETLAREGYEPISQSWEDGRWGCGSFLVALLLCAVVIGILVFIYMLFVEPPGTLTVTYALKPPMATSEQTKVCPMCAETVKEAARVCRFCNHDFIGTDGARG